MTRPLGSKNRPGLRAGPPKGGGRSATVKELDRELIAKLYRRRYTLRQIAEELPKLGGSTLSEAMICLEGKSIREAHAKATVAERAALVEEKCAELDEVIAEAWRAWDYSWNEIEKWVRETNGEQPCLKCKGADCPKCDGRGSYFPTGKEVATKEGRVPGAEFLNIVVKSLQQQAQLRGLVGLGTTVNVDARQQTAVSMSPENVLALILAGRQRAAADPVQARIDAVERAAAEQQVERAQNQLVMPSDEVVVKHIGRAG